MNLSRQNYPLPVLPSQDAPSGFDPVCGTEWNQQKLPVKSAATRGDRMAKTLLREGNKYGKQFVVFLSRQAYPAYVVTYTYSTDFFPSLATKVLKTSFY